MSDLFLLSERQMAHGIPRVDDRRVVSGIVYGPNFAVLLFPRAWRGLLRRGGNRPS